MIPVIADIVSSRELDDRRTAQRAIESAFVQVVDILPAHARPVRPFAAVVGDEFQGAFPTLRAALAATLLVRLALPAGLDLRFGLGLGEVEEIPSTSGSLSEGPGWWAARAAIEHVEEIARREAPQARTWVAAAAEQAEGAADLVRIANAAALARDRVVGRWSDRVRALVCGRIAGVTQGDLAQSQGISQSAVSQTLAAAGATTIILAYGQLVEL